MQKTEHRAPCRLPDGRQIDCMVVGPPGRGPDVAFEAGAFGIYADGLWLARALARLGLSTLLYTRSGLYGSAPLPEGAVPDPFCHAGDLAALLKAQGASVPVVVIGHSMGGLRARALALRHPSLVRSILFLDAVHPRQLRWAVRRGIARGSLAVVEAVSPLASSRAGDAVLRLYPNLIRLTGPARGDKDASLRSPAHLRGTAREMTASTDPALSDALSAPLVVPRLAITATVVARGTHEDPGLPHEHWRGFSHAGLLAPLPAARIAERVVSRLV